MTTIIKEVKCDDGSIMLVEESSDAPLTCNTEMTNSSEFSNHLSQFCGLVQNKTKETRLEEQTLNVFDNYPIMQETNDSRKTDKTNSPIGKTNAIIETTNVKVDVTNDVTRTNEILRGRNYTENSNIAPTKENTQFEDSIDHNDQGRIDVRANITGNAMETECITSINDNVLEANLAVTENLSQMDITNAILETEEFLGFNTKNEGAQTNNIETSIPGCSNTSTERKKSAETVGDYLLKNSIRNLMKLVQSGNDEETSPKSKKTGSETTRAETESRPNEIEPRKDETELNIPVQINVEQNGDQIISIALSDVSSPSDKSPVANTFNGFSTQEPVAATPPPDSGIVIVNVASTTTEPANFDPLDVRFKCIMCDLRFYRSDYYRNHLAMHLPKIKCEHCGQSFESQNSLNQHMIKSHLSVECDVCLRKFSSKTNLEVHKNHHCNRCFSCDLKFATFSQLKQHLLSHSRFKCKDCLKRFPNANSLYWHAVKDHRTKKDRKGKKT